MPEATTIGRGPRRSYSGAAKGAKAICGIDTQRRTAGTAQLRDSPCATATSTASIVALEQTVAIR